VAVHHLRCREPYCELTVAEIGDLLSGSRFIHVPFARPRFRGPNLSGSMRVGSLNKSLGGSLKGGSLKILGRITLAQLDSEEEGEAGRRISIDTPTDVLVLRGGVVTVGDDLSVEGESLCTSTCVVDHDE
jgi:hypothetical protein